MSRMGSRVESNLEILLKLAEKRKTVRSFTPEKPDLRIIIKVLETARQAPSGSNKQPWLFMVIDDPRIKSLIRGAAEKGEKRFYETISEERRLSYAAMGNTWQKPMLETAPILITVLSDTRAPNYRPSVWLSIGYILLALEAAGLHTVTYTPSDAKIVREALHIPDSFRVETILPIGFSADSTEKKPRKSLSEIVLYNQWETPFPHQG